MPHRSPEAWQPPDPRPDHCDTPRLTLRPFRHEDAADLFAAIEESRDTLRPWLPWTETENRTLGEVHHSIELFARSYDGRSPWRDLGFLIGLFDQATGACVGSTGLHRLHAPSHEAEIGYWIRTASRQQGYAAEAARHLISWCFKPQHEGGWGLRRLTVYCAGENAASRRVAQSLGLRQEVCQREARWVERFGWCDTIGFGVLRREWDVETHLIRG